MLSFNFLNMFVAEISIIYSAYTCKRSFPRLNVSTVYTNTRYITSGFSGNYTVFLSLNINCPIVSKFAGQSQTQLEAQGSLN